MEVHEIFDRHAKCYDEERRKLIPCFDNFYGIAIDVMNFNGDNPRVLDLGAGTGILTMFLLDKYPNAKVTLVDLADSMLDVARERFGGNSNIDYVNEDYMAFESLEKFDIIMSSLSIHHLTQNQKAEIYDRYVGMLKDGGIFVNADLVRDEDENVEKIFYDKADDLILKNVTAEAFEKVRQRREFDDTDSIQFQLDCLKDAGCKLVGVPFKFYTYTVLWGQK